MAARELSGYQGFGQMEAGEQLSAVLDAQDTRDVRSVGIAADVPSLLRNHRVAQVFDLVRKGVRVPAYAPRRVEICANDVPPR